MWSSRDWYIILVFNTPRKLLGVDVATFGANAEPLCLKMVLGMDKKDGNDVRLV